MKHPRKRVQTRCYASQDLYGLFQRGLRSGKKVTQVTWNMPGRVCDIDGEPYPISAWDELIRLGLIEVRLLGSGRVHVKLIYGDAVQVYHHVPDNLMREERRC